MADDSGCVLVVDDEPNNLQLMKQVLSEYYQLAFAPSGPDALEIVQKIHPDLILLDIMMPGMDGYEVCRRLKADETTRDIPVIFVTAMGETSDETKGLELGAVDYLTKPISPPIVVARIKTHLALRRHMAELQKAYGIIEAQKERMEEELNVGRNIQMSMVPQKFPAFPERDEFSIHAVLHPAREVGGDFYDFFFIDENRLCFCIGDVAGKGVPAALFMAVTRTLIKARASDDTSTASILTRVNDEISRDNKRYMFITLFVGILDTRTGELVYTNAGHNPTYIRKADGSLERLDTLHGPVVGASEGLAYKEDKVRIAKGDILLMYTDGVTEARNPQKEFFAEQRLKDLLSAHEFNSAEAVVETTLSEVRRFENGADQFDDITLLALQFLSEPEAAVNPVLEMTLKNQLTEIDRFKKRFNSFSEESNIPTAIRRELNIAFDELLNNVISYAYRDDEEHGIEVRLEAAAERLLVSIADDGVPFNPLEAAKPNTTLALAERSQGGLGIHLVRNIMDKVAYQRRADKNVLSLVKNLKADK